MITTTLHRGFTYDVTVSGSLPLSSLSLETMFSCSMEIPGTMFARKKETMFMPVSYRVRKSEISTGSRSCMPVVQAVVVMEMLIMGQML